MRLTEERMRALGLLTPSCVLTLDEWEIPRDRVVINRKLGEGAFGTVYGGEAFFDEKGWVSPSKLNQDRKEVHVATASKKSYKLRENECAILLFYLFPFSPALSFAIAYPILQSKLERLWSVPSFKDIAMRTDLLDSNYLHKDGVLRVRKLSSSQCILNVSYITHCFKKKCSI